MKNDNRFPTANYRLVARQRGESLTIAPEVCDELISMYTGRLHRLQSGGGRDDDRSARAMSLEWERLGDFMLRTGAAASAAAAYAEGLECCTGGVWINLRRGYVITMGMRFRCWHLLDKMERLCAENPRLEAICRQHLDRCRVEMRRI